jgi:glyceraldehyde 3-phosphate dehydrogenase
MPTIVINGLGRIGRAALKILLDTGGLDVVAVNDIADARNLAYLVKYDTVWGAETRIRAVSRRSVPSVDALRALVDRPPTHPPTGPPGRR